MNYNNNYNNNTEPELPEFTFTASAFKHGVTREDIVHAYRYRRYDNTLGGSTYQFFFIGPNLAGNMIEVFYNDLGNDVLRVFHAMACRKSTLKLLQ